jgi:hypothetical protein
MSVGSVFGQGGGSRRRGSSAHSVISISKVRTSSLIVCSVLQYWQLDIVESSGSERSETQQAKTHPNWDINTVINMPALILVRSTNPPALQHLRSASSSRVRTPGHTPRAAAGNAAHGHHWPLCAPTTCWTEHLRWRQRMGTNPD